MAVKQRIAITSDSVGRNHRSVQGAKDTRETSLKPVLTSAPALGAKRAPAKKKRQQAVTTAKGRAGAKRAVPAAAQATAAPTVATALMLRPIMPGDEVYISQVTQQEIAPVFKSAYGQDLDMQQVLQYVYAANTRMVVVNDQPAGYLSLVVDDNGKMNIGSLVIGAEHQGKGYGKRIMRQVEQEAQSMGVQEMEVFVQATNERSLAFAKSLGFAEVTSQAGQSQTIVLVKPVAPATAQPLSAAPAAPQA